MSLRSRLFFGMAALSAAGTIAFTANAIAGSFTNAELKKDPTYVQMGNLEKREMAAENELQACYQTSSECQKEESKQMDILRAQAKIRPQYDQLMEGYSYLAFYGMGTIPALAGLVGLLVLTGSAYTAGRIVKEREG
jgi:hypothetical protein